MKYTHEAEMVLDTALHECEVTNSQFVTPEHVLLAITRMKSFSMAYEQNGGKLHGLTMALNKWIKKELTGGEDAENLFFSCQYNQMIDYAEAQVKSSNAKAVGVPHIVDGILSLTDSMAAYLLRQKLGGTEAAFMSDLVSHCEYVDALATTFNLIDSMSDAIDKFGGNGDDDDDFMDDSDDDDYFGDAEEHAPMNWKDLVTCISDTYKSHNPLIGREAEMARTIQVLCRKDKNNPLHVGEPGVGKTALVYGLAALIDKGEVPERLRHCRIYQMDMGTMLAGTQFRGDFEKRVKIVMEALKAQGGAILYIDEIHTIMGAGRGSDGALDASNMLKPYLEDGSIRFIGSTTYAEYNRHMAQSRGIVRRFQQIDIPEPSLDESIRIVETLRPQYAKFHKVTYAKGVVEHVVRTTHKYVTDRHLPDKAIDLIDEAGAYLEAHPTEGKRQTVTMALVNDILAKTCKIEADALKQEDNTVLLTLESDIRARIFGQDEAVRQVVEAVQMAKAGLADDNKPLASLLFVGPTGVGKTEVARVLADRLGVSLVRFDMSEYAEKHTVAKLIGSPAGYVGYEDGGLLTDAIRKSPNCILLLDEIEKAHQDIYNILLQVMDYARLTDNRGQKADFRNVVLIMTSNAGAQFASQASVGFNANVSRGEAMLGQVKRTFKPEFLNRLSATVVFRDMDNAMARLILDKKLGELQVKLTEKKVTMHLADEAIALLLRKGFTREYGAREMDRAIARELKPLLMRAILFGKLAKGGIANIAVEDGHLILK